ncbi:hypothetical protein DSM3645_02963 [Blastopirellula marina DSM 3645]|uniref:Uncharacterized protein n=1 Tax=Blastopirellula marina DSM 3645 TaxID=314230 RepID=A3ZVQ6_9BACT|nr:hypothetical protein DSM3645_02963 [Blastopirellula marina DSM 3645]
MDPECSVTGIAALDLEHCRYDYTQGLSSGRGRTHDQLNTRDQQTQSLYPETSVPKAFAWPSYK